MKEIAEGIHFGNIEEKQSLELGRNQILFLFCSGTELQVRASMDDSVATIPVDDYVMIANPFGNWELNLSSNDRSNLLLMITIEALHDLFGPQVGEKGRGYGEYLKGYKADSFITRRKISPTLKISLYQLANAPVHGPAENIYRKGKVLEIMSLYMSEGQYPNNDFCPYVEDHLELERIRGVSDILKERMINPPGLKELARMVGTNEFKLKMGFKHLFGNTVFGYLNEYKMEKAREMLVTQSLAVNEVSSRIGYRNPSHFITAFRKKYGLTPKKYLQSL